MDCPACHRPVPPDSRFCPACGEPFGSSASPTVSGAGAPGEGTPRKSDGGKPPSSPLSSSSPSLDQARFVPGTMLADRYRIVALAGKGGMGEVYRAEDLKLGQVVALKFLPEAVAGDAGALARFHREVRVTRQVSHPNVCRVFDIGEAGGLPFMAMEHVDGEDLASLLRRIGRLPQDKAVEIARQMCAGLAAAHEFGVLHRDLKPSNVMLDGRGKARITDFGLAGLATEFRADEIRAGTPAYMAPEQLEGREVTVRSDIYALGLVLYELFTGKRAFEASTLMELKRLQEQSSPTSPSSVVKDLDPAVERAILRCLEHDPQRRPASALQVAAALPGGDPLAAALAAGETPSPEMVAASGETEGLRPAVAWACLAGVVLASFVSILLGGQAKLYRRVPLEKPPDALAERAREVLKSVGYTEPPVDTAVGFYEDAEFLRYIREHDQSKTRWDNLEVGAFHFWYRSSPRPLESSTWGGSVVGAVGTNDPPLEVSGMSLLRLTPRGRLTRFIVVPPQVDDSSAEAAAPDWGLLFAAAGLDPSQWTATAPAWLPPVYSDTRAAWTGSLPERPGAPLRIEAAAYRGQPVYFELIGPWTRPERMQPYKQSPGERAGEIIAVALLLTLLAGSALLARRNLRLGRGDRRGATRVAYFVFATWAVAWLFGADHVPDFGEVPLFIMFLSQALFVSSFLWVLYVALEPYVRRRWPATLVSWSRLLAGGFRDPLVGRDLLVGCLLGAFSVALARIGWFVPSWLGSPPIQPYGGPQSEFLGGGAIASQVVGSVTPSIGVGLAYLFVLFLLRVLLRKQWAAAGAFVLIFVAAQALGSEAPVVFAVRGVIIHGLAVFLLIRFGVLAIMAYLLFGVFLGNFPLTTDMSAWYASIGLAGMLLMAAMAFYGFYTSLGGRPLFGSAALDEA